MQHNYFLIDSSNRKDKNNTNSNDFSVEFNKPITIRKYIKMLYFSGPNLQYNINSKNNLFIFNQSNIFIPIANYNAIELANEIKTAVQLLYPAIAFNMVFDQKTFKYKLSANNAFNISAN